MSTANTIIICCLILSCCSPFIILPAQAFTANSLDISVEKNGDAIATFRFTLEGLLENAIPQSVLEEELKKGLTTSSDPPELKSMDRSSAVLLLKKFADTIDVPTGTEYRTAMMDFKKAEVALQNSGISSVVSADFSPEKIVILFPDSYRREYSNVDLLPAVSHIVIDPSKTPQSVSPGPATGFLNVSSSPNGVKVYLDNAYIGEAPAFFPEIPAGTHTAEFRKDGYESVSKSVAVLEGKTTNVMVVLRYMSTGAAEESGAAPGFVWLFLILALVAIAGGGYYFWRERKKLEENGGDAETPDPDDEE